MADDADSSNAAKNKHTEETVSPDEPQHKKLKTDNASSSSTASPGGGDTSSFAINHLYIDSLPTLKTLYEDSESVKGKEEENKFVCDNFQVIREPFQVVQLKNFIQEDDNLKKLMKDISKTDLNLINNDLYRLKQSNDLSNYSKFAKVCDFFQNDVRPFLQDLTGINLNSKVSLTISRYDQNDYLLCHDDQLENRKIAFILYLTESDWSNEDGGQLELFKCSSSDNQPLKVVKRLNPGWNLFNFFIVQPISYHQVSEVRTSRTPRWTINGWFHTDEVNVVPRNYTFPVISQKRSPFIVGTQHAASYEFLRSWINPYYFDDKVVREIKQSFVEESQIQLMNFLRPQKYSALASALNNSRLLKYWKENYHPVLSKYLYLPEEVLFSSLSDESDESNASKSDEASTSHGPAKIPNIILDALRFFNSEGFCLILSNMTGVRLHNMAKIDDNEKDDEKDDDDDDDDDADDDDDKDKDKDKDKDDDDADDADDDLPSTSKSSKASKKKKPFIPNINISCESKCRGEIRLWRTGDYSLVSNVAPEYNENSVVDTMYFLNSSSPEESKSDSECIDVEDEEDEETEEDKSVLEQSSSSKSNTKNPPSSSSNLIVLSDGEDSLSTISSGSDDSNAVIDVKDSDDELESHSSGSVIYIEEDSPLPLLSIKPENNTFNIVYRVSRNQRFMKYISFNNEQAPFHEISYVYYQK